MNAEQIAQIVQAAQGMFNAIQAQTETMTTLGTAITNQNATSQAQTQAITDLGTAITALATAGNPAPPPAVNYWYSTYFEESPSNEETKYLVLLVH